MLVRKGWSNQWRRLSQATGADQSVDLLNPRCFEAWNYDLVAAKPFAPSSILASEKYRRESEVLSSPESTYYVGAIATRAEADKNIAGTPSPSTWREKMRSRAVKTIKIDRSLIQHTRAGSSRRLHPRSAVY